MIVVGELSLWIALLMAAWCATLSYAGAVSARSPLTRSGQRAGHAALGFSVLAAFGLWTALHDRDFSIAYVAQHITANMPDAYVLAALWSGGTGSLLLWALWLSLLCVIVARRASMADGYVATALATILTFLLATVAFAENPYGRMEFAPTDGEGMNPLLQNPGMLIHPPLLIAGLVTTSVPFAFGMSALATRRVDESTIARMRRWSLIAWVLLGAGILVGMWWAYIEPGWGGYWAWDPVQNAALLPWIVLTAFLHAAVAFERRGLFTRWMLALSMAPFLLTVFAGVAARGVVLPGIHSYARSASGTWFAALLMLVSVGTAYLLSVRRMAHPARQRIESLVSRDTALLFNNVLLVGLTGSVLWGMLFPLVAEWFRGVRVSVGAPFFNAVNAPVLLAVLVFMGLAHATRWRSESIAVLGRRLRLPVTAAVIAAVALLLLGVRNANAIMTYVLAAFVLTSIAAAAIDRKDPVRHGSRMRLVGGYVTHAGIALLCAAIMGMTFRATHEVSLTAGETYAATDPFGRQWRFVSQGISTYPYRNSEVTAVALELLRDGKSRGFVTSERREYLDTQGRAVFHPTSESAIHGEPGLDVYVVLASVHDDVAEMQISFNPLVSWVWVGGALVLMGGVLVAVAAPVPRGVVASSRKAA